MNKRIVSLLLAAVLMLSLLPASVSAGTIDTWEGLTWTLSAGVLTISGTGPMPDATPSWDKDANFTGTTAPWYGLEIRQVIIDEGITTVGANTFFGIYGLETVQLPSTVTVIGERAFESCIDLRTVKLPDGLKEISYFAFKGCESLVGVPLEIPEGVTAIRDGAFCGCMGIKSIRFPKSLTHIGYDAFTGSGLMQVHIPATLKTIYGAFYNCPSLEAFTVDPANPSYSADDQGVLYNKNRTYIEQIPGGYYGELTIPDTVTSLLDENILTGCTQITRIRIPATMKEISPYLFSTCASLETIEVDDANPIYEDIIGVLYGHDSAYVNGFTENPRRALICCPPAFQRESFFIPDDTEVLEDAAFHNCYHLQDVTIPDRVSSAPNGIFRGCTSLYEILVDAGNPWLQSIDGVVFNKADLTAAIPNPGSGRSEERTFTAGQYLYCYPTGRDGYYAIPEGTEYLAIRSFAGSAVEAIRFPKSLKYIDMFAMEDCTDLEWMLFAGSKPAADQNCFAGVTAEVYYPATNPTWEDDLQLHFAGGNLTFKPWGPYPADEPRWPGHNPFTDVPGDSFCYDSVLWALNNGITTGATETTFNPSGECFRAQVVTFLWRAAGSPEPAAVKNPFVDVEKGSFYEKAVLWAVEKGITTGTDATHFSPSSSCNRATVVTFLYRAFENPAVENGGNPFTDVPANGWYTAPVLWAVEKGITNGLSATEFGPASLCNRAQIVTFLYRAYS